MSATSCKPALPCCRDSGKYTFSVACFMLELYQDDLADLLLPPQPKVPTGRQAGSFGTQVRAPKLEIKKDAKGMVSVPGATMIEASCTALPCRPQNGLWDHSPMPCAGSRHLSEQPIHA